LFLEPRFPLGILAIPVFSVTNVLGVLLTFSLDLGYLPFTLLHQVGGQPEPLLRSLRMYITLGLVSYCSAPPRGSPLVCSFIASQNHPPSRSAPILLFFFCVYTLSCSVATSSQSTTITHSHRLISHLFPKFSSFHFHVLHFSSLFSFHGPRNCGMFFRSCHGSILCS